ncbi:hypothetical protein EXIGLDRAFT_217486 [Exidia glandulosa HHB12029]|uniref:Uncharacterized protein n=1 Tax=Exidia glandulosa HHB12029 TaxID=1314781 RepID=A0A165EEQ1_EXIGL|nr:hypothetical protein EXIGLDRAFT_217486 [Exidia glandulosa HHB12029]
MILILYRSSDKGPLRLEASGAVDEQGKHFDYLDVAGLREVKDQVYQAVFAKLSDEDQGKVFWGTFQDSYQKSTWEMYDRCAFAMNPHSRQLNVLSIQDKSSRRCARSRLRIDVMVCSDGCRVRIVLNATTTRRQTNIHLVRHSRRQLQLEFLSGMVGIKFCVRML